VLLAAIGVPVYDGIMAMENNAIPYEFGNIGNELQISTANTGHIADLMWYELSHWGAKPSLNALADAIAGALTGEGIGFIGNYVMEIAQTILALGIYSTDVIAGIILTIAGSSVTWEVLAVVGAIIAAY